MLLTQLNRWLFDFATEGSLGLQALVLVPLGLLAGGWVWEWCQRLAAEQPLLSHWVCPACGATAGWQWLPLSTLWRRTPPCATCAEWRGAGGRLATELATAGLFLLLCGSLTHWRGQSLTEGGSIDWFHARMGVQLLLIVLLMAATVIDLQHYLIPDEITLTGAILGVSTACFFGHIQFIPAWIDWNDPMVPLNGPLIPQWIKLHAHWHGLAWSLAGATVGGGLTWLVRVLSGWILGMEALGFGDVTLMAMIGSFLGWQPIVCVFLIAPLCGLVIGLTLQLASARRAVPYGPYLCAATVIVLCTWRWLWLPTRKAFGDPWMLAQLGGITLTGLIVLLGAIRLYRMIPAQAREKGPSSST